MNDYFDENALHDASGPVWAMHVGSHRFAEAYHHCRVWMIKEPWEDEPEHRVLVLSGLEEAWPILFGCAMPEKDIAEYSFSMARVQLYEGHGGIIVATEDFAPYYDIYWPKADAYLLIYNPRAPYLDDWAIHGGDTAVPMTMAEARKLAGEMNGGRAHGSDRYFPVLAPIAYALKGTPVSDNIFHRGW